MVGGRTDRWALYTQMWTNLSARSKQVFLVISLIGSECAYALYCMYTAWPIIDGAEALLMGPTCKEPLTPGADDDINSPLPGTLPPGTRRESTALHGNDELSRPPARRLVAGYEIPGYRAFVGNSDGTVI